ncbi:MAG: M3 family oligoendopeptidase [Lachnospiraceae bacterium]|nr:M3 family oligoendopeptidase [Lachnospiraceae bacterium]
MKTEWNLGVLYKGFDDPQYEKDIESFKEESEKLKSIVNREDWEEDLTAKDVEDILVCLEKRMRLMTKLFYFSGLSLATDTENGDIMAKDNELRKITSQYAAVEAACDKLLALTTDIEKKAKESKKVEEYVFLLNDLKEKSKHLLSNEEEAILAGMDMTGGSAWGTLQSFLTSTVKIDYAGEQVTLSEIRNLAYDKDAEVRKSAYEAEIAGYEKIADSVAFALNNIKNQTWYECEKRGYESPLAMTLSNGNLKKTTLDAMFKAIDEYLPVFRKYFRKKGELLGHKEGLPWYELFAPLGEDDKKYTLEEAKDYLVNCYKDFTPELSDMIKEAFENEWIDFYPKKGKEGGAFCAALTEFNISRILTNYDGTFGAVDTLAHELGHAYQGRQMKNTPILNQDEPMQLAETASTFNEVFLGHYALERAEGKEKLALLDSDLKEKAQCVVDIYSRYIFETEVFEKCRDKFLMKDDLNKMMLEAQDKTYGDGLDKDVRHPYMWACKSHYYSAHLSFYNFPYAFGNLLAQGLYAMYLKEGEAFIPKYNKFLAEAGSHTTEECGMMIGANLEDVEFWRASLQLVADEIEEFVALVD